MESSSANTGPATTAYQITGLAPGTEYTVNVTAHNSVGESDVGIGNATTSSGKYHVVCWYCIHTPVEVNKSNVARQ